MSATENSVLSTDAPCPFAFLGFDRRHLYFLARCKLMVTTVRDLGANRLQALADASWWTQRFPLKSGRPGYDQLRALDWVVRSSHASGLFDSTRIPDLLAGPGPWAEAYTDDHFVEHLADMIVPASIRRTIRVDQDLDPDTVFIAGPFPRRLLRQIKSRCREVADDGVAYPTTFCGASAVGRRVHWIVGRHPHAEFLELDLPQLVHALFELAAEVQP